VKTAPGSGPGAAACRKNVFDKLGKISELFQSSEIF
jgi:hypothetical protein